MAKKQLLGNFYFQQTVNGNLIGEFTNNLENRIFSESADRNPNADPVVVPGDLVGNQFLGEYNSSWRQGNSVFGLTLKITRIENSKFDLVWTNDNHVVEFRGQGFMDGDKLIGYYRQATNSGK